MIGWLDNPGPPPDWDDPEPPEIDLMDADELWALVDLMEGEGLRDDELYREALDALDKLGSET